MDKPVTIDDAIRNIQKGLAPSPGFTDYINSVKEELTQLIDDMKKEVLDKHEVKYVQHTTGYIFPVIDEPDGSSYYFVPINSYRQLRKVDCEPYVFPTPVETTQDIEQAATAYANRTYNKDVSDTSKHFAKVDFKAGYVEGQKSVAKESKAGYTITEEQIEELNHLLEPIIDSDFYEREGVAISFKLREWFPTAKVFTPQKQVIAVTDRKGTEYYKCEVMGIMQTTKDKSEAYILTNASHATELIKYLQSYYDDCQYSLDLAE